MAKKNKSQVVSTTDGETVLIETEEEAPTQLEIQAAQQALSSKVDSLVSVVENLATQLQGLQTSLANKLDSQAVSSPAPFSQPQPPPPIPPPPNSNLGHPSNTSTQNIQSPHASNEHIHNHQNIPKPFSPSQNQVQHQHHVPNQKSFSLAPSQTQIQLQNPTQGESSTEPTRSRGKEQTNQYLQPPYESYKADTAKMQQRFLQHNSLDGSEQPMGLWPAQHGGNFPAPHFYPTINGHAFSWAEYWHNTAYHTALKMTPFEALYGYAPPPVKPYMPGSTANAEVDSCLQKRDLLLKQIKENLEKARARMKYFYDMKHQERQFMVGDMVFLKIKPYRQQTLNEEGYTKLSARYYGPFEVMEKVGAVAYRLQLPAQAKILNVFHVSLLKKKLGTTDVHEPALPVLLDASRQTWKPARILQRKMVKQNNRVAYKWLIAWSGVPEEEATWEDSEEIIDRFPEFNWRAKA